MQELRDMAVSSLMGEALQADPETEVSKIIGMLKKNDAYEVFSIHAGRVLMATVRDLLNAKNLTARRLATVAQTAPKLSTQDKISNGVRILTDYRIRALPVMEKGSIVGALHAKNVAKAMQLSVPPNARVSSIMTPYPITISSGDSVLKARSLMLRRKIDQLPILKDGRLAGVSDSSAILFAMIPPERQSFAIDADAYDAVNRLDFPVDGIMDSTPLQVQPNDNIRHLIGQLLTTKTNYALVTWEHEIQGIVTLRDIVKILAEEQKQAPQLYMVGLPEDPFEAETAKTKFSRIVGTLSKSMDIVEARAKIKLLKAAKEKERNRYEVKVSIATPSEVHSFSDDGFSLADIFDELQQRIRRINVKRPKSRPTARRTSE